MRSNFKKINPIDIVVGLSIAGLLLPEAVAYASIANLPPQAGIIALFVGLICYGIIGESRFAIVAATSSSAAVLAAATSSFGADDTSSRVVIASAMVLLTGIIFFVASAARMGSFTDFIAKPVLRGFVFGLAIVIIIRQFATIVGMHSNQSNLFYLFFDLIKSIKSWNIYAISMSVSALALLFLFAQIKAIPGGLIVIALGIGLSYLIDLTQYHIQLVGAINLQIVKPSLPAFGMDEWMRMLGVSLGLAMILYSESYGSIQSFALKHNEQTNPNRDLFALGVANLLASLLNGMPVAAGYSATSANEAAGSTSKFSGLFAAAIVLAIILIFLSLIALTPQPVLASIVIYAVSHSLSLSKSKLYFVWKRDRIVVISAIFGVLLFGVLNGLLIAILLSMIMLLKRFSASRISILGRLGDSHDFVDIARYDHAVPIDNMLIIRPEAPFFFANCERIISQVRHKMEDEGDKIHFIILSLEESPDIDGTSIECFCNFFSYITTQNKMLVLARLKDPVSEVLKKNISPYMQHIHLTNLSIDKAVNIILTKQL